MKIIFLLLEVLIVEVLSEFFVIILLVIGWWVLRSFLDLLIGIKLIIMLGNIWNGCWIFFLFNK